MSALLALKQQSAASVCMQAADTYVCVICPVYIAAVEANKPCRDPIQDENKWTTSSICQPIRFGCHGKQGKIYSLS